MKALNAFLLGLAIAGLGLWNVYKGECGLCLGSSLNSGWCVAAPNFSQTDSPFMFSVCVSTYFVTALILFVVGVAYAQPES